MEKMVVVFLYIVSFFIYLAVFHFCVYHTHLVGLDCTKPGVQEQIGFTACFSLVREIRKKCPVNMKYDFFVTACTAVVLAE